MILKAGLEKYRIMAGAVMFSLAAHLFWVSAVRIEPYEAQDGPVRFSKVSFLGPIVEIGPIEFNLSPRAGSFLERRYMEEAGSRLAPPAMAAQDDYALDRSDRYFGASSEMSIIRQISGVLAESKPEPSYPDYY